MIMHGIILELFCDIPELLKKSKTIINQFNWLITGYDCYSYFDLDIDDPLLWFNNNAMVPFIDDNQLQFIWGVFSGFDKDISPDDILKCKEPYANGNKNFWDSNFKVQHPLATMEIVAWDSSSILIISKSAEIINFYKNFFSNAKDLKEYNLRS